MAGKKARREKGLCRGPAQIDRKKKHGGGKEKIHFGAGNSIFAI